MRRQYALAAPRPVLDEETEMTAGPSAWRRRLATGIVVAVVGAVVAIGATPADAAAAGVAVSAAEIGVGDTVTISYDAAGAAGAKNWIGIYRHGEKPGGGTSSLDWRYAPAAAGGFDWGPRARTGWTQEASAIAPGDLDVYLFANDSYRVISGPVALRVSAETVPPRPAVGGVSPLDVLTLNIWKGGSVVADGIRHAAEVVQQTGADVAFLPERFDPALHDATPAIAAELGYHSVSSTDTGVVSRYPIVSSTTVGTRWTKVIVDVNGTDVAVYGGHLEYRWYSEYLPRGYGPTAVGDWPSEYLGGNELGAPVTDVATMLAMNEQSGRPESARQLLQDVDAEEAAGRLVVVGGDFNEPSAQDWTVETRNLFDHRGTVVPWQTTQTLIDGGVRDSYRQAHPDPVKNPGFTWPAGNPNVSIRSLTWAPKADERDRIDYIFYVPSKHLGLVSSEVVGPKATIVRSQRVDDDSDDVVFTPDATWPSDHKGVLSRFTVCTDPCGPSTPTGPTTGHETLVASGQLRVGGALTVGGSGFVPGSAVTIELHSAPVGLGTVTADANGALEMSATIPADVAPGPHDVVAAIGGVEVARVAVEIGPAPGGGGGSDPVGAGSESPTADGGEEESTDPASARTLANTGLDAAPGVALAAVALIVGISLAVGRRRSRSGSSGEVTR
jgi:hypothetical protein